MILEKHKNIGAKSTKFNENVHHFLSRGMISSARMFTGSVEFITEAENKYLKANIAELDVIVRAIYLSYEYH